VLTVTADFISAYLIQALDLFYFVQYKTDTCLSALKFWRGKKMTASQKAKQLGCKSLTQVSELTGASLQTLTNWHKNKPDLFYVVCVGVCALGEVKR
jgi:hypothetical protein